MRLLRKVDGKVKWTRWKHWHGEGLKIKKRNQGKTIGIAGTHTQSDRW